MPFRQGFAIISELMTKKEKIKEFPVVDECTAVMTPLGTGGWIPSYGRQTASYVFQKDELFIILDFGTGIARILDDFSYLLDDVEKIIGFLSHYHPDHTIGLSYLPSFLGDRCLELYAPGKGVYEKSAREILADMFKSPRMPKELEDFLPTTEIKDIPLEGMTIDDLELKFRPQLKHAHPSVAIRIGDHLAYCTDTEPEYATIGFAHGVNLLLHEVWYDEKSYDPSLSPAGLKKKISVYGKDGHTSNVGAAFIARESKVGEIMTIHHHPMNSKIAVSRIALAVGGLAAVEMHSCEDGVSENC
jgi:ribonuclease BN (tRNA processing enzyme)